MMISSSASSWLRTVLCVSWSADDGVALGEDGETRARGHSHRHRGPTVSAIRDHLPAQWAILVDLGALCGLRFGEATSLRRTDVDLNAG